MLAKSEWKPEEDSLSYEPITDIISIPNREQKWVHVTLSDGKVITATEGHPFRTVEGWRDAVLLRQGDTLILTGSDGKPSTIQVDGIRYETKVLTTYNLEVANAHTFFVGEDAVLVHNCPISMDDALDEAQKFLKPNVPVRAIDGPYGVQFIQNFVENGKKITKRVGFDVNPNTGHVKQYGPHLNLQTQVEGKIVKTGPLADPHTPIDPATIRKGDY